MSLNAEAIGATLECAWCGCDVEPVCENITGAGFTYPRDEQGDVCCEECRALPSYYVKSGNA